MSSDEEIADLERLLKTLQRPKQFNVEEEMKNWWGKCRDEYKATQLAKEFQAVPNPKPKKDWSTCCFITIGFGFTVFVFWWIWRAVG